jgi:tetratricopeptide (TPR) repeat protein
MSQIAIYAGWYTGEASGPFSRPHVEFMPGAFAYHLHSFSADTIRNAHSHWCGPLLAQGATCTMGCVYEPYLQMTPDIAVFLQDLFAGYTFGEAAWAAQPALSWQTTVIGDPLYSPFTQTPRELHARLAREHSPLIAWSFNRLVNLDRVHGLRPVSLGRFLEDLPETTHSAVLAEKLAILYDAQGKPSSAIKTWQLALTLHPSPEQRLRLRLTLGQKLEAQGRLAEALDNYRQLLRETPDYPGKSSVEKNIKTLRQSFAQTDKH